MAAQPKVEAKPKTLGMTLDDFRSKHDKAFIIPQKIKAGLARLTQEKIALYETDFANLCGIAPNALSQYRDQFQDNWVATERGGSKRAWAGDKKMVEQMRNMVNGVVS